MKRGKTQHVWFFYHKNNANGSKKRERKSRGEAGRLSCLLSLLLALICCLGGCTEEQSAERYLSFRQSDFTVTLTGNRGGRELSCAAEIANGEAQIIRYTAPEALRGLTLRRAEGGEWIADFGGIQYRIEREEQIVGLLEPVALLLAKDAVVQSVRKLSFGVHLTLSCPSFSEPISLTLSENGLPSVLSCNSLTLRAEFPPSA